VRVRNRVPLICFLLLLIAAIFGLSRLEQELPGMPLDVASERYPVLPGESAWQQMPMPMCQPTRLTFSLAQTTLAPGTISASIFVRNDRDRWPDEPAAIVRTSLIPGQAEVRLPFPVQVRAERRMVRVQLTPTPQSQAVAFRAARDTAHETQYVTKKPGYLGLESLVFRAEYPGERWLTPVTCVTSVTFPNLPPTALIAAVVAFCGMAAWLCGIAWGASQQKTKR
jgi:hypothetical protein